MIEVTDIRAWKAGRAMAAAYQRSKGRTGYAAQLEAGAADYSIDVVMRAEGYQLALNDLAAGRLP